MCLYVGENKSYALSPIYEMEVAKCLFYHGSFDGKMRWVTPYRNVIVEPGTGWFMPADPAKRRKTEFKHRTTIGGGYLHAYGVKEGKLIVGAWDAPDRRTIRDVLPATPRMDRDYLFKAYARDVVATDNLGAELVCRALYIPAFDLTGEHRHAILDM